MISRGNIADKKEAAPAFTDAAKKSKLTGVDETGWYSLRVANGVWWPVLISGIRSYALNVELTEAWAVRRISLRIHHTAAD